MTEKYAENNMSSLITYYAQLYNSMWHDIWDAMQM